MFPLLREDWRTYERDIWRQGLWAMAVYRFGRWRYGLPGLLRKPMSFVYRLLKIASQILTGIDLPCEARVGRRLRIEHFGGIVVSGDAAIGDDVVLRNGVTIGLRRTGERGAPEIGNGVDIGAGAKLLGPIRIGDGAVIGANAVVLCDVPAGALAVGIPARIIERCRGATGAEHSSPLRLVAGQDLAGAESGLSRRYP
jgi:serine O-acetyltransferase